MNNNEQTSCFVEGCTNNAPKVCFACGNKFCSEHGTLTLCEACDSLQPFGDTYRFCLKDGTFVEDVSTIPDDEVVRLLEAYGNRVHKLEELIRYARAGTAKLSQRLKPSVSGENTKLVIHTTKAKPSKAKLSLEALADLLFKSGSAKQVLDQFNKKKVKP